MSNYVDAMMYGLDRLRALPLSLRLIREMQARLLQDARGSALDPGEFRRSQNWLGGARPGDAQFVPPPVTELDRYLGELEAFMHEDVSGLPHLVKAGLPHVQFETIHPFLDGNGRMGRLLVTLYLCVHGGLTSPLLYLSLYLKTHRAEYYRLLQDVRERGAWPEWLAFFLRGVEQTATQAFTVATRIERRGLVWLRGGGTAVGVIELQQSSSSPLLTVNYGLFLGEAAAMIWPDVARCAAPTDAAECSSRLLLVA